MKKTLLYFSLSLFSYSVYAAEATLTWIHPTQNEDGTPIVTAPETSGALESTRIEFGSCSSSSFGTKEGEVVVPYPATTTTIKNLKSSQLYCFRAYSQNNLLEESLASNVASRQMPNVRPKPPSLATDIVVANTILWKLDRYAKRYTVSSAGYVKLGTPCKRKQYEVAGVTYNVVKTKRGSEYIAICEIDQT
jgi:hypothetical protein